MKITIGIDDKLLSDAKHVTGITDTAALVRAGVEALLVRESAQGLIQLAGSDKEARPAPRWRSQR
ncbi:MAG: type II toxin-antitoxin system VapB family antitoxin [Cyanobacteria bacterium J06639_1]